MTVLYRSVFDAASVGAVMMEVGGRVDAMVDDGRRLMIMARESADNAVFHSGEWMVWWRPSSHGICQPVRVRRGAIRRAIQSG